MSSSSGNLACAGRNVSLVTTKRDETVDTPADTTLDPKQRATMRSGEQDIMEQLIPSARYTYSKEKRDLSKKTAYILRHAGDCFERDGACSWTTCKVHVTIAIPKVTSLSPYNSKNQKH